MAAHWRGSLLGAVVFVAVVASVATVAGADVGTLQVATCTAAPTSVAPGETVELDAAGSDANVVEFDTEGNGEYTVSDETDFAVQVTYNETGTYQPRVRANGDPEQVADCGTVTVEQANQPPQPALSISPRPGTVGQPATFDASSSTDPDGDIVDYAWDFDGDGFNDNQTQTPTTTHTYRQAGSYVARVTAIDDDGETASVTRDYFVQEPVQARCTVDPASAQVGQTVIINATGSANAELVDYDTDGDGEYERSQQTTFTLDWTYREPGTYAPQVRVRTGDRVDTADCGTVTVAAQNRPPEAALSVSPRPGVVGQPSTFDASNSTDPDGDIVAYRWDFDGNGTVDAETNASTTTHAYAQAAVYAPRVTVVDDDGANATAVADYRVREPAPAPQARCFVEPTTVAPGGEVTIDARESANAFIIEYDTDGDGIFETEREAFVLTTSYDEPGTYNPRVRVTGEGGSDTADCGEVVVREPNAPPEAALTVSPRPGIAGQPSTFDASNSTDSDGQIVAYRWDFDGDGTVEEETTGDTVEFTFDAAGSYVPRVTVVDDDGANATAVVDYPVQEPVQARCSVDPTTIAPGETVTIDASASENAETIDYDIDGDGEYERRQQTSFTIEVTYNETGEVTPRVRVRAGDRTAEADCGAVTVEARNAPPEAALTVSPRPGIVGQPSTFDASNSTDSDGQIVAYRWDFDGDGTVDRTTDGPTTTANLSAGGYTPSVTVVDDDNATATATAEYTIAQPTSGDGQSLPWLLIGAAIAGLLGLAGLGWYLLRGRGGGGGDDDRPRPRKPPKPPVSTKEPAAYETGVFEIPQTSGTIAVSVGFEPDLIVLDATNGARTDSAVDRTAGWSRGVARADGTQYCVTLADDSQSADQATSATREGRALELIRHESDAEPGRVTLTLAGTTDDGFEIDVSVPGDDPLAGGARVLYRALRTATGVETAIDHFETPTEPGVQTVELGVDADHISLTAGTAVEEPGRLWTTDRGVGLTVGQGVTDPDGRVTQTARGTSVWPRAGHDSAAVAADERVLQLLYKESDRVAGRLGARLTALGESLRLGYDRVYSGPNKLGSTDRHIVPYLALAGRKMCPAVGAVSLPEAGDSLDIDCGFQPALVELTIVPAGIGETVSTGATAQPFGWSQGTAIDTGDGLRQYVLHHAFVPAASAGRAGASAEPGEQAAADGGKATPETGQAAATERDTAATRASTAEPGDPSVGAGGPATVAWPGTDDAAGTPDLDDESGRVAAAPERPDDGIAGLALLQAADGTIRGRETTRVTGLHEQGFGVAVERVTTRAVEGGESTLVYRAWPAAGSERATSETRADSEDEQMTDTQAAGGADR
jgi:PKD repeat protein